MALTNNLPPQAYTRDTLVKAIEWLSSQPASVRERAKTADLVVSFYLQARRRATALQNEAPASQENFKADLKNLAQDFRQFEEPSSPQHPPARPLPRASVLRSEEEEVPRQESLFRPEPVNRAEPRFPRPEPVPSPVRTEPPAPAPSVPVAPPSSEMRGLCWEVDARSLQAARELQQRLNLSSEGEALRMLVSMGAERLSSVLP